MTEEKFKKCKDLDNDIRIMNTLFEERNYSNYDLLVNIAHFSSRFKDEFFEWLDETQRKYMKEFKEL